MWSVIPMFSIPALYSRLGPMSQIIIWSTHTYTLQTQIDQSMVLIQPFELYNKTNGLLLNSSRQKSTCNRAKFNFHALAMFEAHPVGLDYFCNNWDAKDKPLSHLWWFIMEYLLSAGGVVSLINHCLSFPDPFNNSSVLQSPHTFIRHLSIQKHHLLCQSSPISMQEIGTIIHLLNYCVLTQRFHRV